jgi:cytochrome c-type biogenesis protein CcmH
VRWLLTFRAWLVALVAVGAWTLLVTPHPGSAASRIAHLESLVRCPSCEDLSVAQSSSTSAIAVRHQIERSVRAGRSDTEILTTLESRYGTSILLSPPTSGLGALLYLVPIGAAVVLVAVVATLARRRR